MSWSAGVARLFAAYEGFMAESNAYALLNKPTGRLVHRDRFIKAFLFY